MITIQLTNNSPILKLITQTTLAVSFLGLSIFGGFLYSQRQSSNLVFPNGVTYTGKKEAETKQAQPSPTPTPIQPSPTPIIIYLPPNVSWTEYEAKNYSFSFSYPSTFGIVNIKDANEDKVAFSFAGIPPEKNLLMNIEVPESKDSTSTNFEFVTNWYKNQADLKGVLEVEKFRNSKGLEGFRAIYININNNKDNIHVFLQMSKDTKALIHFSKGLLDQKLFDRIVNSVKVINQ